MQPSQVHGKINHEAADNTEATERSKTTLTTLEELGLAYNSESLSEDENQQLKRLLEKNSEVFAKSLNDLPGTTMTKHTIHTSTEAPVRQRCYRHSAEAKREIER